MVGSVAQAARTLDEIIALLCDVETATLGHILTEGFLPPAIQGLQEERRICGRALTVSVPPDDGAILAHALSHAAQLVLIVHLFPLQLRRFTDAQPFHAGAAVVVVLPVQLDVRPHT